MGEITIEKVKIRNHILSSPLLRRVAFWAFNTPLIVDNPVYKRVYQRQINYVIEACSKKPQCVIVEVTNVCNLRCPHCTNKDMQRKRGFMDLEIFKKVVDECITLGVDEVCITGGEPTLHLKLMDMVDYAKRQGIKYLNMITNAQILTLFLSEKLIKVGLDALDVSIDAVMPETYKKMRPPGNLEATEANLMNLFKLKKEMGVTKPRVTVKFIKQPENASELNLFKQRWENLADEIFVTFLHNWAGAINKKEPKWIGGFQRFPCSWIFRQMYVCWDGRVSLCCLDYEVKILLGDAKAQSIREIWHSPKLREIKQVHLDGNFNAISLCSQCSFRDLWWLY